MPPLTHAIPIQIHTRYENTQTQSHANSQDPTFYLHAYDAQSVAQWPVHHRLSGMWMDSAGLWLWPLRFWGLRLAAALHECPVAVRVPDTGEQYLVRTFPKAKLYDTYPSRERAATAYTL